MAFDLFLSLYVAIQLFFHQTKHMTLQWIIKATSDMRTLQEKSFRVTDLAFIWLQKMKFVKIHHINFQMADAHLKLFILNHFD